MESFIFCLVFLSLLMEALQSGNTAEVLCKKIGQNRQIKNKIDKMIKVNCFCMNFLKA